MPRKLTKDEFITKANLIHGDGRFDYSEVEYFGSTIPIKIKCNKCQHILWPTPNKHLDGRSCLRCSGTIQKTTAEFIVQAQIVHHEDFDYSKVNYKRARTKVIIGHKICGTYFSQTPDHHLHGNGCPKCAKNCPKTHKQYIEKASKIHNNKYKYLGQYINMKTPIEIECPNHGIFTQDPNSHLNGSGCPICSTIIQSDKQRKTLDQFIEEAHKIHHNKYDYSLFVYIGAHTISIIICPKHGSFLQEANNHIRGHGCPLCSCYISRPEIEWLDSLSIPKEYRQAKIRLDGKLYKLDALDPITNIVYEFNGDYWHGNPQIHDLNDYNEIAHKTFGELYQRTIDKAKQLTQAGYTVISMWEYDWNQLKKTG